MGERENIVTGLKAFRQDLNRTIHVERMIFFGSRVSGKPHPDSDIDLLIVSDYFEGKRSKRALGFRSIWNLDYPVDFLCYTSEEFERLSKQVSIVREAVETGIEIN